MSDELAAIRERHGRIAIKDKWPGPAAVLADLQEAHGDRRALLALLDTEREARASADASVAALREGVAELTEDRTATDPDDEWHRGFHEAVRRLRDIVMMADTRAAAEARDAAIRREAVEGVSKVDVRLVRESIVDQIGAALSREFAQGSPFEPFDRQYVIRAITAVLDDARKRIRFAAGSDA